MTDLIEVHRARVNLRQCYEAIEATGLQAKPALLGSLNQADDAMLLIIRKSAKRGVRFGAQGGWKRLNIPTELVEQMCELAPEEAERWKDKPPPVSRDKMVTRAESPAALHRKIAKRIEAEKLARSTSSGNQEAK